MASFFDKVGRGIGGYFKAPIRAVKDLSGATAAERAQKAQDRATRTAETQYGETAPFRALGGRRLTQPTTYDFAADYAGAPEYRGLTDPLLAQATSAQGKSLADLMGGAPDRLGMVKATLADLDAANAPRLEAGIRRIGQRASTLGRIGSEGVGTEIGDLKLSVEQDRARQESQLVRDMIEAQQGDKYRTASLAGAIGEQAYGRAAGERGYGDELGFRRIGLRERQRQAERGAAGEEFGQGMSLSELGYGFSPEQAYNRQAAAQQAEAARRGTQFADFLKAAGTAVGRRGK